MSARTRHVLGVAAGRGITPVITVISRVLAGEPHSRCTLIYGNGTSSEILFADRLTCLEHHYGGRLRIIHLLSREHPTAPLCHGRISADTVVHLLTSTEDDHIDDAYLRGPQPMTIEIRSALLARGLATDRIQVEHFTAPSTTPRVEPGARQHDQNITIVHNGTPSTVVAYPGETVLDSGLRAGLDLPYSCRAGVCGTCRAVNASEDNVITSEPHLVLACQTQPHPGVMIDFDAANHAK